MTAYLLFIIFAIVFAVALHRLTRKVYDLERELRRLSGQPAETVTVSGTRSPAPAPQAPAAPLPVSPQQPSRPAQGIPLSKPAPVPQPAIRPSRTKEEWEALIGGKILNRIGALAIIIGVGFFLKYATDRHWINEVVRVMIGAGFGGYLLYLGWRSRRKEFVVFSQGLIGAGIAVLYLTAYASFNYYHLVSQGVAYGLMSVVTIIAFHQGLVYDSVAVSILGWAGGSLTPVLLGISQASALGLFSYLLFFGIGILSVTVKKKNWNVLEPLTFGTICITYILWHAQYFTSQHLALAVVFLTLFWLVFYALYLFQALTGDERDAPLRQAIAILNTAFYYTALYVLINPEHHRIMGLVTTALSIVYVTTSVWVVRRRPQALAAQRSLLVSAAIMVAVAAWIQYSRFTIAAVWSVEALILTWCGLRWNLRYLWKLSSVLFCLAGLKLLLTSGAFNCPDPSRYVPLVNGRSITFILAAGAAGVAAALHLRYRNAGSSRTRSVYHIGWLILMFGYVTIETLDIFHLLRAMHPEWSSIMYEYRTLASLPVVWTLFSLAALWWGASRVRLQHVLCGLAALGWAMLFSFATGIYYPPISEYNPLLNVRAAAVLLHILGLFTILSLVKRHITSFRWFPAVLSGLRMAASLMILVLITGETLDYFRHLALGASAEVVAHYGLLAGLVLACGWAVFALAMIKIGVARTIRPYLYAGLGALAVSLAVLIVRSIYFPDIQRFGLVFNIRFVMSMLVAAAGFISLRVLDPGTNRSMIERRTALLIKLLLVALFLGLLTGEAWNHFDKVLYLQRVQQNSPAGWADISTTKNMQQLALSLAWVLYSIIIMLIGIARRMRWLRIFAFALVSVTVLKIFAYDLSYLETLHRIFSFIALGIVLLAVSFLYQKYKTLIFGQDHVPAA